MQAPWTGFADIGFRDEDAPGMSVRASANTARALVYLPGANVVAANPSLPEEIVLSLLARIVGDPNLQILYAMAAGFTVLVSTFAAFVGLHASKEQEHAEATTPLVHVSLRERLRHARRGMRDGSAQRRAGARPGGP